MNCKNKYYVSVCIIFIVSFLGVVGQGSEVKVPLTSQDLKHIKIFLQENNYRIPHLDDRQLRVVNNEGVFEFKASAIFKKTKHDDTQCFEERSVLWDKKTFELALKGPEVEVPLSSQHLQAIINFLKKNIENKCSVPFLDNLQLRVVMRGEDYELETSGYSVKEYRWVDKKTFEKILR